MHDAKTSAETGKDPIATLGKQERAHATRKQLVDAARGIFAVSTCDYVHIKSPRWNLPALSPEERPPTLLTHLETLSRI